MLNSDPVLDSFVLYLLYVLLPLIPAVLIFWLFPEGTVAVEGPLQNLTVKATGAFAAYVVTVVLGFFLVQYVETQIVLSRKYAFEGVIVDLGSNQLNSDQFYVKYATTSAAPGGQLGTLDYDFVILLDHQVTKPERVWLKYWDSASLAVSASGGQGPPPGPTGIIPMVLEPANSFPVRFRLQTLGNQLVVVPEDEITTKAVAK